VTRTFNGGEPYEIDLDLVRPDGTLINTSARGAADYDASGKLVSLHGTVQDITERKKSEMALQVLNETLEQRVQEQIGQIVDNERLLIEQSRSATMGEMIRNIAHQWRQPLNTVGLVVQNIRDDFRMNQLNRESLESDVETVMRCIMSMSRTIDDFRNFYRPDKDKALFNLHRAIDEALHIVAATLKNNCINVTLNGDQSLQGYGYINEFSQVILNLIANASDALTENKAPHGMIEIELTTTGQSASVVVRDNAGGLSDEVMAKIFEPYFTTKISGSGIGLYMSRIIIEKHMGGSITCRNTEAGAEFTVSIPLRPENELKQDSAK
jgi:signal transduction histidine kinase